MEPSLMEPSPMEASPFDPFDYDLWTAEAEAPLGALARHLA